MPEHSRVQPPLRFVPPRYTKGLFRLVAAIYPFYLRFALNIRRIDVEGIETLVDHYRRFQDGKIRLIIAFRHPHVDDGAIMAWLLGGMAARSARREAKREGRRKLARRPFGYFVYDRGAPLWAGAFIGWLLPRMGAISVFRGKLDSHGLEEIRSVLANADQPLAIAPEGAVSYSERYAAPLETGVAHFAFWCVRDLLAANRSEQVVILPVTPAYRHGKDARKGLERITAYLERECGLPSSAGGPIPKRLRVAAHTLFRTTEHFYRQFHAATSESIGGEPLGKPEHEEDGCPETRFCEPESERVGAIVEAALQTAEQRLGLRGDGEPIPRVRRIEQACWDRIYREDIADIGNLPPLDRALADRIALETSLTMRHLQLADIMVYLSELSVPDEATTDELAETASNLAGIVARLEGGDISSTPRMGSRSITYRIGEPLSVTARWASYRNNRQAAVGELMTSLREEFQRLSSL